MEGAVYEKMFGQEAPVDCPLEDEDAAQVESSA